VRADLNLSYFKKALLKRREVLLEGRGARDDASRAVELDQSRVGRLSRMDAMQQQAVSQAANRQAEVELQRIGAALKRLDSDEYGYCVLCDEPIAEGRLRVDPSILICIACARESESK
jgi:DnaK suppressor protein